MGRSPSIETQLKNARREARENGRAMYDWKHRAESYERQVRKLEREVVEWKERFDVLLRREPNDGTREGG